MRARRPTASGPRHVVDDGGRDAAARLDVEHPEHVDGPAAEKTSAMPVSAAMASIERAGRLEQRAVALGPLVLHEQLVAVAGRPGRGTAARPAG